MTFWQENYQFIKEVYEMRHTKMAEWMENMEKAISRIMADKVYTSAEFKRERDSFHVRFQQGENNLVRFKFQFDRKWDLNVFEQFCKRIVLWNIRNLLLLFLSIAIHYISAALLSYMSYGILFNWRTSCGLPIGQTLTNPKKLQIILHVPTNWSITNI